MYVKETENNPSNPNNSGAPKPGRDGSWGAAARDWAEAQEATMQPVFEAVLDRAEIGEGKAVLDVGCGTGLLCLLAFQRGAAAAGLDASTGQLEVARERLPQADFRLGEMEQLPFEDEQFDLITSCNALQYSTDTVGTLREMARVAKPGAIVGIMTGSRTGPSGMSAFYSNLGELREKTSGPDSRAPRVLFSDPDALIRFMQEAGLEVFEEQEVDCDWDYPDLATALKGGLSFAPGVRILQHAGKDAVHRLVEQSLEPYKIEGGGYHIPNRARYVLGRVNK